MSDKTCKECGITKDYTRFYAGTGRICKECKISQSMEYAKDVKGLSIKLLKEMLEKQDLILVNQEIILERCNELEQDVNRIRKTLKKMA